MNGIVAGRFPWCPPHRPVPGYRRPMLLLWAGLAGLLFGAGDLEPLARLVDARLIGPGWVWAIEAGIGVLSMASLLFAASRRRGPARAI